jgi:hypothetical protein
MIAFFRSVVGCSGSPTSDGLASDLDVKGTSCPAEWLAPTLRSSGFATVELASVENDPFNTCEVAKKV